MRTGIHISLFIAALILIFVSLDRNIPSQHLFWRGLNPASPPGFATRTQLLRLSLSSSERCMALADHHTPLRSQAAQPKKTASICGWNVARTVDGVAQVDFSPQNIDMQCPLSLGVAIWTQDIDRLAQDIFGSSLRRIQHYGSYSCRRQNGNTSGAWSEHAFGNAWDVSGFELDNGHIISIQKDWHGDPAARRFLRKVRKSACQIFRVTLSPDFNTAHHDHFHVDMGPTTSCR